MKALTTPSGNFGPYTSITTEADRYHCDDTDLPFSVVGQGEIVDADTIVWPPAPVIPPTRDELKAQRADAVAAIQVTTGAGNTFNGDETSQSRLVRAVVALDAAPVGTTVNWVLADNSVLVATKAELTEALMLAGAAQAAIWVIP
jgi:penicillin V acylase-like amidase (Ntn superfamily)